MRQHNQNQTEPLEKLFPLTPVQLRALIAKMSAANTSHLGISNTHTPHITGADS